MKKLFPGLLAILIAGCGGGAQPDDSETNVAITNPNDLISIQTVIPYSKGSAIKKAIKLDCTELQAKLSTFIRNYSASNGIGVVQKKKVSKKDKGKVLVVEITDAVSSGNAFIGHRKAVTVNGTLYNNGKNIGNFRGMRQSGGGFMGGFKGSCSVLGRTVKALGSDIGTWLTQPTEGAMLGDL